MWDIDKEEIEQLRIENRQLRHQLNLMEFLKDEYYFGLYSIRCTVTMNRKRIPNIRKQLDALKIPEVK